MLFNKRPSIKTGQQIGNTANSQNKLSQKEKLLSQAQTSTEYTKSKKKHQNSVAELKNNRGSST